MSIASRWAAWDLRRGGSPAGPLGGEESIAGNWSPRVEIFVDESWVDITRTSKEEAGVYYRDKITISRGRQDESSTSNPTQCTFTLNNRDGRFSPKNPLSPYYGKIGRNTRCRVSVLQNGVRRYRFYGEISAWPMQWDIGGNDVYVPIVASGITRRLSQGSSPSRSAMYRAHTNPSLTRIKAYWPCEDGSVATEIASGLPDAPPMVITGVPDLASYSGWHSSDAMPTMGTGRFSGVVPSYTATGTILVYMFVFIDSAVAAETSLLKVVTSGTARTWDVRLKPDGAMRVLAEDSSGANIDDGAGNLGASIVFDMNSRGFVIVDLELKQDGSDVAWGINTTDFLTDDTISALPLSVVGLDDVATGQTIGRATRVIVGDEQGLGDVKVSHIVVSGTSDLFLTDVAQAVLAFNGESPLDRFRRICNEENIDYFDFGSEDNGTLGSSVTMGWQTSDTLINHLQAVENVGDGLLYEPTDALGLAYKTRVGLYNQDPWLTLDYSNLSEPPNPPYDDQRVRNDITISRTDGASSRAVLETGPMSVQDPPDGVGQYDTAEELSLADDGQTADQAGWRLWKGTVDEPRYPSLVINLSRNDFLTDLDLTNAALTTDIGHRIVVENPPPWLPPDDISLLVIGYTETFDQFEYSITFNCTPESPYEVGFVDGSPEWRVDTDGSQVAVTTDSSASTLQVAVTDGALWTTDSNDWPFDIRVHGMTRTVTAVSGTSSPQTFTVTPATIAGTAVPHLAGDDVRLAQPTVVSL